MLRKVLPVVLLIVVFVFASQLFVGVSHGDVNINNVGNVQINSTTQCNTGGNVVAGQNSGIVTNSSATTGNANCGSNVRTQVNTNTVIVGESPTASPTVDPCSTKPCTTPTPTSGSNNGGGSTGGGNGSDGLGCATHDCSGNQTSGSSAQQGVLGASTMASTGTFAENVMNTIAIIGMIVLSLGGLSYAKEKNR